jgi:hypothetical protein
MPLLPHPDSEAVPAGNRRGSLLVTAMLIAAALALGLAGYLSLGNTALKLSQRTLFMSDAGNLAEAGLEEALYCFNQLNAGAPAATAWSGWTLSGGTARRTLPQFNRDQNGIGTVKVFVSGYDGSGADRFVISQATITPFDGSAPMVKIVRLGLKQSGNSINGLVALSGLRLRKESVVDSFNSNPTNSPTGPWRKYSKAISEANASVVVLAGKVDLADGLIKGNLALGPGVDPPPADQVTGTIESNYPGNFTMPAYPTAAGVSRSYPLGSNIPSRLPVSGHEPAADGRYYYFVSSTRIEDLTITSGRNVTIVGTTTSLGNDIRINPDATLAVYIDRAITASAKDALDNASWAGALQIFTTSAAECTIRGNDDLRASVYAPNANLRVTGGGTVVGSFIARTVEMTEETDFHFDEALRLLNTAGGSRASISSWEEVRPGSDLSALRVATNNFLP